MEWYIKVLKNYANFNGRARRKEYWMFILINTLISVPLMIIDVQVFDAEQIGPVRGIYTLAVLLPSLAVIVRRMHDVGKSGWFMLIPIYNFVLAVTEGDSGPNEYGGDPKVENGEGAPSQNDLLDDQLMD